MQFWLIKAFMLYFRIARETCTLKVQDSHVFGLRAEREMQVLGVGSNP